MNLQKVYHEVNAILNTLDFNALFAGFRKYKFALYTGQEICLEGRLLPYQEDFRGNTSKRYEGEYIAIWNLEFDPVEDPQMLAYLLVHEMFHCHQYTNHESRFPSDLVLLNYPKDTDNYLKKYNENRYLADAYEQGDLGLLQQFAWIREQRARIYPDMVMQEYRAETIEGMAEYVGLKALRQINEEKFAAIVNRYLDKLRAESASFFDVRRMAYYSGAIYFLCLDKLGLSVRNDFAGDMTAYEQNPMETDGIVAEIHPYGFLSQEYARLIREREAIITEHIARSKYVESNAVICGYDPMNMFRVGDMIYCSHFVCLEEHGEMKMIQSAVALKSAEGSNQTLVGYYL